MAILVYATSWADFNRTILTANEPIATTAQFRSPDTVEGFELRLGDILSLPLVFTAQSSFWCSYYHYVANTYNTTGLFVQFNNGTTPVLRLANTATSSNPSIKLQAHNGTAWVDLTTTSVIFTTNTLYRLDIEIVLNDTTGKFNIYVDGVLTAQAYSGDTIRGTPTTIDRVLLGTYHSSGGSTTAVTYSGVFVSDTDSRGIRFLQVKPSANGNYTSWTGDYTAVDETGFTDSDVIATTTNNQVESFQFTALSSSYNTGYNVIAVGLSARASKGDISHDHIDVLCRSGTTDGYNNSVATPLILGPMQTLFTLNPATSAAFTYSEASSCELGVRS